MSINRKEILYGLWVLISILCITYLFPGTSQFRYSYEQGRPWRHDDLIAEFDFDIPKSEEELSDELAVLAARAVPYYRFESTDPAASSARYDSLLTLAARAFDSASVAEPIEGVIEQLQELVKEAGQRGILPQEAVERLKDRGELVVLRNSIAARKRLDAMRTEWQAEKWVLGQLESGADLPSTELKSLVDWMIRPNLFYDDSITVRFLSEEKELIDPVKGRIQADEIIVSRGGIVTAEVFQALMAYESEYEKRVMGTSQTWLVRLSHLILSGLVMLLLVYYLRTIEPEVYSGRRNLVFILALATGMLALAAFMARSDFLRDNGVLYAIPFSIVPIVLRSFFGFRVALFTFISIMLMVGFLVPLGYGFVCMHIVAGGVALFGHNSARLWSQYFTASGVTLLTYLLMYAAISLEAEGGNMVQNDLRNMGWLVANVFISLLSYPLIPLFEKSFGFLSNISLVELSDLNNPLLKRLSLETPGTFQHSLQVANLAEAAAFEIGADTLLVKVGALYHDIGKMENPQYFTENQLGINPHDELSYEDSAGIIIRHVSEGELLARKHGLPEKIIDFIRTHHGTTRTEYFFNYYKKKHPDEQVDEQKFRYPGPVPFSRETALLMMADSVEAASRSLQEPGEKEISELVDRLVDYQIGLGQFDEAPVTFADINKAKAVMKKMLNGIYHVRVAYPENMD